MGIPIPYIVLTQETRPPKFDALTFRAYRQSMDDALVELAQYLQDISPRGISPAPSSLKGSWDIVPSRKLRGLMRYEGSVVNFAPFAPNRLEGRGPGKFPPFGPGTPLAAWANSKGIPPFLVARKIAREGTERWKETGKLGKLILDPSTEIGMKSQRIFQKTLENSLAKYL